MRIVYIHQFFKFPSSSGGTRSYDLAESFISKGMEVTMVTSNAAGGFDDGELNHRWTLIDREGIRIWVLNNKYGQKTSFVRRVWKDLVFAVRATLKVLKLDADIVLATSTPLTVALPALVRKRMRKTPFVFEVRDVWPEVPIKLGYIKNNVFIKFLHWFEKHAYQKANCVVALSDGMKANILSRVSLQNIEVIPNISETARFANIKPCELGIDFGNKKWIVYAGTIGRVNGLIYLAKLAEATFKVDTNICYLIVGWGKEKDEIICYCEEKGILEKNIFFRNPIRKDDLPYLYSKATMGSSFVTNDPILWDNSANKFFDTLAAGKPLLINHEGWQADTIRKYNCGYVLPPVVTESEAKDFVEYLGNVDLLNIQGENAFDLAKREYSLGVAVDKYMKIFGAI